MSLSPEATAQDDAWQQEAHRLLEEDAPFAQHVAAHKRIYGSRRPEDGPPQVWRPTADDVQYANLARLIEHHRFETYADLHAWSIEHRAGFWNATVQALNVPFIQAPNDTLTGPADDPTWLDGAQMNIVQACFTAPGDKVAIIEGGEGRHDREVSYSQLRSMTHQVAHGLRAQGFEPGDGIALYLPMNVECVAAYLGIIRAGCVAISIPDSFAPSEVATRLALGEAKAVITVGSFKRGGRDVPMLPKARDAVQRLTQPPKLISIGGDLHDGELAWEDLLVKAGRFEPVPCEPQDVTNILFSSGTTGEPKAIPWTHLTPIKAAADGMWHQDIHGQDVVAWPTNIGWMMGPWLIYASLVNEATMALYEGVPTSPDYIDFLRRQKITVLGLVPAIVRAWRQQDLVQPGGLADVRIFSSTGEASNAEDYLYLMSLARYQAPIIEYCGGTEIGGGHLTGTVLQPASPATFTTPAMGLDFVVLDDDGRPVPEGGMGELFLVPPSIGLSQRLLNRDHHAEYYAGCPKGPNGETLRRHGDEVQRLHQGFYTAQGRADDTMNLGGIKVGSIDLERAMNGAEGVVETAAVGIPPPEGGADRLIVFTVAEAGAEAKELQAAMQARIKERLNPLFRIHDVVLVESLPRTASNKVMRRELRKQYAEGTA